MACEFTDIPLIVLFDLFRKRFQKHTYLGSSLEILAHFGIQLESDNDLLTDIPGDGFKYSVWCLAGFVGCRCRLFVGVNVVSGNMSATAR